MAEMFVNNLCIFSLFFEFVSEFVARLDFFFALVGSGVCLFVCLKVLSVLRARFVLLKK